MNQLAIVTGGSSGIGLNLIEDFNSRGVTAISWDLRPPTNSEIKFVACDVSSEDGVLTAHKETLERFGEPTILVNNAGLQHLSPIDDFSLEKWNQIISVVLTGTFLCSRTVIPAMKKRRAGRIVNVSSIHGKVASPFKAAYVSAKHGVLGLTKVMAQELGEFNITVNSVCPGFVDTPLLRKQITAQAELNHIPEEHVQNEIMLKNQVIKKFTTPEQISQLVGFLCSEAASTVTGEAYNMAGGWGMGS
jgi:3-hydroxybutyrate dehydrogenase